MHPQVSQALIVILNKCLVPDRPIIVQSHYVNFNKSAISVTVKMTSDRAVSMCQPHTSQTQNHKANKHTLRNIRMLTGIKINPSPMKTTELNTQAKYGRLSTQTHTSMEIEILRKKQVILTNYTHTHTHLSSSEDTLNYIWIFTKIRYKCFNESHGETSEE